MSYKLWIVLTAVLAMSSGCATMSTQEKHSTPAAPAPQVSKTIQAQKSDQPTGLKRKVAIGRFSNETRYGQSFFLDEDNNRIGKQAMDILSAKLFETGKFIMLERADLARVSYLRSPFFVTS